MGHVLLFALNAALPGAGLVLRARLGVGRALLLPAWALLGVAVLGSGLRDAPAVLLKGAAALVAYLGCALLAALAWWWDGLRRPVDGAAVLALHRQAAT